MADLIVDGLTVHCREAGDTGPGVLLLHSSASTGGQWRTLVERLAPRYRTLAPDLLGYGGSDPLPSPLRGTDLDAELAVVLAVMDRAGAPAHLVGHSYGGYLAAVAALARPGAVASLTLVEPTLFFLLAPAGEDAAHAEIYGLAATVKSLAGAGRPGDAARVFLDYWVGPGALDAMPAKVRDAVVDSMDKQQHEWPMPEWPGLPDVAAIAGIEAPVHLVRAAGTTRAAAAVVAILRRALPGARYSEIPADGHMSPVTRPDLVDPVIERFIDGLAGA